MPLFETAPRTGPTVAEEAAQAQYQPLPLTGPDLKKQKQTDAHAAWAENVTGAASVNGASGSESELGEGA